MGYEWRIGNWTRRQALMLAGGLAARLLPTAPAAAEAVGASAAGSIMTRPIPSSGERLPVVGLGTDQVWRTDTPEYRALFSAILRTLVAGGGSVVDTASNPGGYFLAEPMLRGIRRERPSPPHLHLH
jgi:hypothetical protein